MRKFNGKTAKELHQDVPPGWYFRSLKEDVLQKFWHTRRFSEVGALIEPVDGKVLDIGCADGVFTNLILKKTKADGVIGIDVVETSLNWAKHHWRKNKKLKFMIGDAHKLAFPSNFFSAVFALEVLEHVFKPKVVLEEIKRVLKKGGYGVLLVPSESILFKIVWFLWHFYGRMVWKDTHVQHFRNSGLTKLVERVGFEVEEDRKFILGMLHVLKIRKI